MIEAAEAFLRQGFKPVSMIGFGDPSWFAWWRGGVTTVRPPVEELAKACGLWFLNHLRDRQKSRSTSYPSSITGTTLVIRASALPPPVQLPVPSLIR